jgi:hypothetical protein
MFQAERIGMFRNLALASVAFVPLAFAQAAELDGISMPDAIQVAGGQMHLNGIGLRTYSFVGIRVYVAGLYLERRTDNSNAILQSQERKLLSIRFLRDVDAEKGQQAWRDGLRDNCTSPCSLDPRGVERFLAAIPAVHKGDESTLLFTPRGVNITMNGRPMGDIADPYFAQVMLATFIGPAPATPRLKRELLGARD